jgi:hypothetical protein
MILRGGRLTHADMAGLDDFKAALKRGIDVMLLGKKLGLFIASCIPPPLLISSHLLFFLGTRSPKVLWMDTDETRIISAT